MGIHKGVKSKKNGVNSLQVVYCNYKIYKVLSVAQITLQSNTLRHVNT